MKIAIASDHRGVEIKSKIASLITSLDHEAIDLGPNGTDSVDYPDFAAKVASGVSAQEYDRGILICGTGLGMCITANKFHGVRATSCHDELTARMSRLHNDANILCLSADLLSESVTIRIVKTWMETEFEGGRHERRVEKISAIEESI